MYYKELSIFIDESGKFGDFSSPTKYYMIGVVFHDQSNDISSLVSSLENYLKSKNLSRDFYIHSLPIVRNKGFARVMGISERRSLIARLFKLFRMSEATYVTFYVERQNVNNIRGVINSLTLQINDFLITNSIFFSKYDKIKIYYDRGQKEVTRLIRNTFCKNLKNAVEKDKVSPVDYRLLQVADLVCTIDLIERKIKNNDLTKSEDNFFHPKEKLFRKNYLKPLEKKRF